MSVSKHWAVRVQLFHMYPTGDCEVTPFADTHPDAPSVPTAHGESDFIAEGLANALLLAQDCVIRGHAAIGESVGLPPEMLLRRVASVRVRLSNGHGKTTVSQVYTAGNRMCLMRAYIAQQLVVTPEMLRQDQAPPPPPPVVVERRFKLLPQREKLRDKPANDDGGAE